MWWVPLISGARSVGARYLPEILLYLGIALALCAVVVAAYFKGQSNAQEEARLQIAALEGQHAAEIARIGTESLEQWQARQAEIDKAASAEADKWRASADRLARAVRGLKDQFNEDVASNPVGPDCVLPDSRLRIVNQARACTDPDPRNRPSVCAELF